MGDDGLSWPSLSFTRGRLTISNGTALRYYGCEGTSLAQNVEVMRCVQSEWPRILIKRLKNRRKHSHQHALESFICVEKESPGSFMQGQDFVEVWCNCVRRSIVKSVPNCWGAHMSVISVGHLNSVTTILACVIDFEKLDSRWRLSNNHTYTPNCFDMLVSEIFPRYEYFILSGSMFVCDNR